MTDDKRGHGVPFVKGSETSADAADDVKPRQPTQQARVLETFRRYGATGLTDEDLEEILEMKHQTASARRRELEQKGVVQKLFKEGKHLKRENLSGSKAGLYVLSIYAPEPPPEPEEPDIPEGENPAPVGAYDTTEMPKHNRRLLDAMEHHVRLIETWRNEVGGFFGPFLPVQEVPGMIDCIEKSYAEMMGMVESFQVANQIQIVPSPNQGILFKPDPDKEKGDIGG